MLALCLAALIAADDPRPAAPYKSVAELKIAHDRTLVADLEGYLKANPKANDRDLGYMAIFDVAIEHDWFADVEALARDYLDDNKDGAVRPLARIVATMARAQAGRFDQALAGFKELMAGLDRPDQQEFAANFADNLANAALTAGENGVARQVYETLLDRYGEAPELRRKIKDDLGRLDRLGRPAPTAIAKDIDGKAFRLSDLRGKYVLVDFWATWCAPCLGELPNIRANFDKYHAKGFEVVGVSLDETAEPLVEFVKARKLPWAQVHNATCGADLVELFGVNNIPATFLVGPDGSILRLELRGPALGRALEQYLK